MEYISGAFLINNIYDKEYIYHKLKKKSPDHILINNISNVFKIEFENIFFSLTISKSKNDKYLTNLAISGKIKSDNLILFCTKILEFKKCDFEIYIRTLYNKINFEKLNINIPNYSKIHLLDKRKYYLFVIEEFDNYIKNKYELKYYCSNNYDNCYNYPRITFESYENVEYYNNGSCENYKKKVKHTIIFQKNITIYGPSLTFHNLLFNILQNLNCHNIEKKYIYHFNYINKKNEIILNNRINLLKLNITQ